MSTNQRRIAYIPSTDSPRPGLVVGVLPLPPTSLAQSGIVTDPCLTALSSVVGGRLRRPFACAPFSAPRLSPRGGATIALPFHGICWLFSGALFQSAFRSGFFRAQVACGSLYRGYPWALPFRHYRLCLGGYGCIAVSRHLYSSSGGVLHSAFIAR